MSRLFQYVALLWFSTMVLQAKAQLSPALLRGLLQDSSFVANAGMQDAQLVQQFYGQTDYKIAWLNNAGLKHRQVLLRDLQIAGDLGLETSHYRLQTLASFATGSPMKNMLDSATNELLLTDAALHFYGDVRYGSQLPSFNFDGVKYKPDRTPMIVLLAASFAKDDLTHFLAAAEPADVMYVGLKQWLRYFNPLTRHLDFSEVTISAKNSDVSNKALVQKLMQLRILDSAHAVNFEGSLAPKIKEAQALLGLQPDGVLGPSTLRAMNVPIQQRIEAIKVALNYMRWMGSMQHRNPHIVVNLPSASLQLYQNGEPVFDSKIIAGKPNTPTPTLSSTITEVILYPYWTVPQSIATKELLPKIKRNTSYLEQNNFQVLNRQGKLLDPHSINWQSLSASNFPYTIRQSTGCDNSLGLVKLNFANPFSVYLHDTPAKTLFNTYRRFYSHGCVRVAKAAELAAMVAKEHRFQIDSVLKAGCLHQQEPIVIAASQPMNVYIIYSTVWFDVNGRITFYDDVYNKLKAPASSLNTAVFNANAGAVR
ncbi:L,D-transpeptidase family protein [Pseudocnuella soli]|uniref:L,D-transpeptidase family protein n=1 Tax=Pseudocnuella soli TaxID=2502779 RepID=UPI001404FF7B|nr:L,D-transpeptidase family protein [Pseudocnuella soli]